MLPQAEAGVLFYAGHGLQVSGRNHLLPVDARLETRRDLDFGNRQSRFHSATDGSSIAKARPASFSRRDVCDNPLMQIWRVLMGTARPASAAGWRGSRPVLDTFIAYSTQPGNVAL